MTKEDKGITPKIEALLQIARLSKLEAKQLAQWHTEQTGTLHTGCFCSSSERVELQLQIKAYLHK